jgi:hypothetical protein
MGIDSIRSRPPVSPQAAEDLGAGRAGDAPHVGSFRAEAALHSAGIDEVAPVAPSILDQVRSGQIDVARYLDLKVEEATAHLRALPPDQLASIRSTLRDRLASDPALAGLVEVAVDAKSRPLPPDDG